MYQMPALQYMLAIKKMLAYDQNRISLPVCHTKTPADKQMFDNNQNRSKWPYHETEKYFIEYPHYRKDVEQYQAPPLMSIQGI